MKNLIIAFAAVTFLLGCARVSVGGSKEPIKVDIAMRLDVYQHVEKDIDAIEDIVSGPSTKDTKKTGGNQSFLSLGVANAYAAEGLSPEIEQAALRRKDRVEELWGFEEKGVIGESKAGLAEVRNASAAPASVKDFVAAENKDRMEIYKSIAAKNNTSLEEVQDIYAKKLQEKAPAGTPVEVLNASGKYEWRVK